MKTLLILLVLFVSAFAFFHTVKADSTLFSRPYFNPVIVEDGRSVCEKNADMYFGNEWSKVCDKNDRPLNCELNSETVKWMIISRNIVLGNCERMAAYGRL